MYSTRIMAFAALVAAMAGCGGFETQPLTHAVLRGSLVGAGPSSMVSIIGHPELVDVPTSEELAAMVDQPNLNWAFELANVPVGSIELIMIISPERADRLKMDIEGGEIEELTPQVGQRIATFAPTLDASTHQLIRTGTVTVKGTPIKRSIQDSELLLDVPAGCYDLEATVPGLGSMAVTDTCVAAGIIKQVPIYFDAPAG